MDLTFQLVKRFNVTIQGKVEENVWFGFGAGKDDIKRGWGFRR